MDSHICRVVLIRYSVLTISFFFLRALPPSLSQPPPPPPGGYESVCSKPYKCEGQPELYYPFWGGHDRPAFCGGGSNSDQFQLTCELGFESQHYNSIQMGLQKFEALDIDNTSYTMKMVPLQESSHESDVCFEHFNFTLSPVFRYNQPVHNITVISDCHSGVSLIDENDFICDDGTTGVVYYVGEKDKVLKQYPGLKDCRRIIQMPAEAVQGHEDDAVENLKGAWGQGFNVTYSVSRECMTCVEGKGAFCRSNDTTHEYTCYCSNGGSSAATDCFGHVLVPVSAAPPPSRESHAWNWKMKLLIGVVVAIAGSLIIIICKLVLFPCVAEWQTNSCWLSTKANQDIEAFLKNHGALTLKRYKFSDVKKITNSFKIKLGQGGFGAVYKGKLHNGSNVAVKILTRSKGNGEEFINEVASISRTSHVNVVTLLGFCIEGGKRVLIYEFMSNGSLDKFIYNKGQEKTTSLSWDNLYQIVIGIARGLEYLHRGCSTRILHFDIKPHNILLDENFCPKISDFGLAKLCPRKESIISMSDARGTIGYIAPEVWNRHFGGVSHKSDVYSYGMMLLDIVGVRNNAKANTNHTSEYFPDWIYKRLEQETHLGVDGEVTIVENEVIKRMTMVGLWSIQPFPNDRPTMSRVVEMLEGNINSLEMPPKPVLSSPAAVTSVVESSTTVF